MCWWVFHAKSHVRKTIEAENWSGYPIWGVAKLGIFTLLNRLGIPPQLQRMKVDRFTFIFTIEILEQTNHLENLSCWVATGTNRKKACIYYYLSFSGKPCRKLANFQPTRFTKTSGGRIRFIRFDLCATGEHKDTLIQIQWSCGHSPKSHSPMMPWMALL